MKRLRCSRCKKVKREDAFSPRHYSQKTVYTVASFDVTYRNACSRGRHYWCKACRNERYREEKTVAG